MDDEAPLVAVVDDEECVRRALLRLLRSADYRTAAFASAVAFLESLDDVVPDCLILDLQMPVMSGFELQRRLRERGSRLPIIVITAHHAVGTRERCLALGAQRYFCKPADGDELLRSVHELTQSPPAA